MNPELAPLALLWSLATGHPDAWLLKQYADSARVPVVLAWAVVSVESGHGPHNNARGRHGEIGRMQLLRRHTGVAPGQCGILPLTDYRTNICVGMVLLRRYYEATGSWEGAVRRYNGAGVATLVYLDKVEREMGRIILRLEQANGQFDP